MDMEAVNGIFYPELRFSDYNPRRFMGKKGKNERNSVIRATGTARLRFGTVSGLILTNYMTACTFLVYFMHCIFAAIFDGSVKKTNIRGIQSTINNKNQDDDVKK
jgi:hypothetical protein